MASTACRREWGSSDQRRSARNGTHSGRAILPRAAAAPDAEALSESFVREAMPATSSKTRAGTGSHQKNSRLARGLTLPCTLAV